MQKKPTARPSKLIPRIPRTDESFATLLRREGPERLDEAITQLKRAYQYDPNDPRVSLQLALCYESKDNLAEAATLLEKTVQGDSTLVAAHIALARIDSRLGKKSDAEHEKEIVKTLQDQLQQQKMKSTTSLPNPRMNSLSLAETALAIRNVTNLRLGPSEKASSYFRPSPPLKFWITP